MINVSQNKIKIILLLTIIAFLGTSIFAYKQTIFYTSNHFFILFTFSIIFLSLLLSCIFLIYQLNLRISKEKNLIAQEKNLQCKIKNLLAEHKQLQDKQQLFALALAASHTGIWDWEVGSQYIFFSKEFKQLLGYAEHEFPNTLSAFEAILHPEDYGRVFSLLRRHIDDDIPYDIEYRLKVKSGEYRWFHAIGQATEENYNKIRLTGTLTIIAATMDEAKYEKIK